MRLPKWFNFTNYLAFTLILWQLSPRVVGVYIGEYKVDIAPAATTFLIGVWIFKKFLKRESLCVYRNIITLFVFLLILMQTVSLTATENLRYSIVEWYINVFIMYFIFFIISDQISSVGDCKKILNAVAYICPVIAGAAFFEYFMGINIFGEDMAHKDMAHKDMAHDVKGRVNGPFEGAIVFGNYLAIATFIVFYKLVEKEGLKNLIIWGALFLITLFALVLTGARGSIVPVAIALGISPFIGFKMLHLKRSIRIMVYVAILVSVFWCLLPVLYENTSLLKQRLIAGYLGFYGDYASGTEEGHFLGMKYVMPAILRLDMVLIGYGPGAPHAFDKLGSEMFTNAPELNYLINWSPSVVQSVALECGILAAIIFTVLLVYPIFLLFRGLTTEKEYQRKVIAYSLFLAFFAFAGSLVFSWHRHVFFLFFTFLGIVQVVLRAKRVKVKL